MKGTSKSAYVTLLKLCPKKSPEFFSLQGEKKNYRRLNGEQRFAKRKILPKCTSAFKKERIRLFITGRWCISKLSLER